MTAKNPIKFLDPYTKHDLGIFFGREKETRILYEKVNQAKVTLLYGLSGTGKTSLIQCGLENKYEPGHFIFLYIRKGKNIINSIRAVAEEYADSLIHPKASPRQAIETLYFDYLTPLLIVFDQFEELFISGSDQEKKEFIQSISEILQSSIKVKFIFSLREEYLAELDDFEEEIPSFFDFRFRIEKMRRKTLEKVIFNIIEKAGIQIKNEKIPGQIIDNISNTKGAVELPYLQVYLDKLKRVADEDGKDMHFTERLIQEVGELDDVLGDFLDEQISLITTKAVDRKFVEIILKQMISVEGTKCQLQITDFTTKGEVQKEQLSAVLKTLENSRIITFNDGIYELSHDSLARKVAEKRSTEELVLIEMTQLVRNSYVNFTQTQTLLEQKQIDFIKPYCEKLKLEENERNFIKASEKKAIHKSYLIRLIVLISILSLIIFSIWLGWSYKVASDAKDLAEKVKSAMYFYDGRIALGYDGENYGYINTTGEGLTNFKYDKAGHFDKETGITYGYIGNASFFLDGRDDTVREYQLEKIDNIRMGLIEPLMISINDWNPRAVIIRRVIKSEMIMTITIDSNSNLQKEDSIIVTPVLDEVLRKSELRVLLLDYDSISLIPQEIGNLKKLRHLQLSNNLIEILPDTISYLTELYYLDLSNNKIKNIQFDIGNLSHLRYLDLSNNQLENLPEEIGNLENLEVLRLSKNKLKSLPESISKLTNLKVFEISFNDSLSNLPIDFGKLNQLSSISIIKTALNEIPPSLFNMKNLKQLVIENNRLESLVPDIKNLSALELLYINEPNLIILPNGIGELAKLTSLKLVVNQVSDNLPDDLSKLSNLKELYVESPKIPLGLESKFKKLLPDSCDIQIVRTTTNTQPRRFKVKPK